MHKIFDNTKLLVLDIMGVILTNGSLIKRGLYPIYKEKYSYSLVKGLYSNVRHSTEGDTSLWKGLNEKNYNNARRNFLDKYKVDYEYETFKRKILEKDIKLGVFSNMPKEWADYLVKRLDLNEDYSFTIFSGYVGLKKPDIDIYEYLLKQSNYSPNEIVFIDDKLRNLAPASKLGIKTVHFKRKNDEFDFKPDLTMKSFSDMF